MRNNSIHVHENLYINVHSNFVHNSPKLVKTQMSFNGGTNWYNHSREHYSAIKKNKVLIHVTIGLNL